MLPARRRLSWSLLLITSWLAPANGLAQILKGQIDQLEGTKCRLMIRSSDTKWDRAVSWRVVSGNRCLTLGESKLKKATHTDGDDPELHAFEFETPKVNPGVALNAELHFHVETSDEYPVLAIRVRATNPFASLQKIMQEAGVALYDPRRETAATLEGLQVKFLNVNSLKESKQQSIVVLGEGSGGFVSSSTSQVEHREEKQVEDGKQGQKELLESRLLRSSGVFSKHLEAVSRLDADLQGLVAKVMGSVSADDVIAQRLGHIITSMQTMHQALALFLNDYRKQCTPDGVKMLRNRVLTEVYLSYTAEDEREVFHKIFGQPREKKKVS